MPPPPPAQCAEPPWISLYFQIFLVPSVQQKVPTVCWSYFPGILCMGASPPPPHADGGGGRGSCCFLCQAINYRADLVSQALLVEVALPPLYGAWEHERVSEQASVGVCGT